MNISGNRLNRFVPGIALIVLCSVFSFSCTTQNQVTIDSPSNEIIGLSIEYLLFSSEDNADLAQEYLFNSGYEIEIEQAIYDDEPVFLLQVPQIEGISTSEFLDMEYAPGVRIFPIWYSDSVMEFIMYFD